MLDLGNGHAETTPADDAREHLATISRGWAYVLDPIHTPSAGTTQGGTRAATEDDVELPPDARLDTPRILAFWVHAALDEWPTILQTLQPDDFGGMRLVTTRSVDCTDVPAMADLLHRAVDRLVHWVEPGHDYGATFTADMATLARVVARVAWPPKGDRLTIGDCPTCGRRVRVKAPTWWRVPQPTTNEATYPAWEWKPMLRRPITCRCGLAGDVADWHGRLAEFEDREPKTASELVAAIRERMGLVYQPLTIRTWQRRGMIRVADYSESGHARYDVTQVLAALTDREKRRDRASLTG